MKKLLLIAMSLGIGFIASAQIHGGGHYGRPRVTIVAPYIPVSPYFGYGLGLGFGYNPYYGYPPYYRSYRSSKLDLQIEDIKNDYSDRIWSAKHDTNLSRKERREKVHELKHDMQSTIIDAKRNYYKTDVKA